MLGREILGRKLGGFSSPDDGDRARIDSILGPIQTAADHTDLIREGDRPSDVFLIVEGFACRCKMTKDGHRQIMAYLIPGDLCDLHVFVLEKMDHSIGTLSRCKFIRIPRASVLALLEYPRLARALMYASLVDSAVLREWLVNVGQRPAEERLAHLFCELLLRMRAVGLTPDGDSYVMPITQIELADTTGMTPVHVNRMLQSLRDRNLIVTTPKSIRFPDIDKLNAFAGFNPNYLHMNKANGDFVSG